jgi:DNA-binding GntR family transcriptional regulator
MKMTMMAARRRADAPTDLESEVESRSKADDAYDAILQTIREGHYAPGERLVFEQIARTLGVSVVPVREAIRRLEADGYVTFTRNIGATVRTIDLDRYADTMETVAALEGIALGLAAPHLTASDLRHAAEINRRLEQSLESFDADEFSLHNRRFHEALFNACPNQHLLGLLEREWAVLETTRRSVFALIPERAIRSVAEHEELLALIDSGSDPAVIERFARDHRMSTARGLLRRVGDPAGDR